MSIKTYLHIVVEQLKNKTKNLNCHQTIADGFLRLFFGQWLLTFTRHMDCLLPACSQSLLKHDWSMLLELQTDYKRKQEYFPYQNLILDYRFIKISARKKKKTFLKG